MKFSLILLAILAEPASYASEKLSEPFFYAVVGKVCIESKCQNYSNSGDAQIKLIEDASRAGSFTGELKIAYSVENIQFVSVVQMSEFEFSGKRQTNFYLRTTEVGNTDDHGAAEVITDTVSKLNSVAHYSTPFLKGNIRVEPIVIIGPTAQAVSDKIQFLKK